MSRRERWRWMAAALPALLGLFLWAVFALGLAKDWVVFARASLRFLLLGAGLLISLTALSALGLAHNLRRRAAGEQRVRQARQAAERQQFLLRLDHELKNPLTALQVELGNLKATTDGVQTSLALSGLHVQTQRLTALAAQLRKLAELETQPIEHRPVRLAALLDEVVAAYQAGGETQIGLSVPSVPWPLPDIPGDEDLLFLAFYNVLGNAVKFTRPGDTIQVRAFEDGTQVVVEVADSGPGIPEDELPHVWQELFRGQQARGMPGSGLGLPLVRAIVERHGGQSALRSRAGQGTIVTLRFPAQL